MAKIELPPAEIMDKRRKEIAASKERWIINPTEVKNSDEQRCREWAQEIMKKNESNLSFDTPNNKLIASGELEPEEIDMRLIYPFPDLNWIISRNKQFFTLMLLSQQKMLFRIDYAKI